MKVRVLLFKDRSPWSKLVKFATWGPYSHAALLTPEGTVIDCWPKIGVQEVPLAALPHRKGTPVDVFDIDHPHFNPKAALDFARRQIGKPYDLAAIVGLLLHCRTEHPGWWFCSELLHRSVAFGGTLLLNCPSYKVTPSMLAWSPRLRLAYTITL